MQPHKTKRGLTEKGTEAKEILKFLLTFIVAFVVGFFGARLVRLSLSPSSVKDNTVTGVAANSRTDAVAVPYDVNIGLIEGMGE